MGTLRACERDREMGSETEKGSDRETETDRRTGNTFIKEHCTGAGEMA